MKVYRTYKTEIGPNLKQRRLLSKSADCARFAYNWGLSNRINEYELTGNPLHVYEQQKQFNAKKRTDFPWVCNFSKSIPQEALKDLNEAYFHFYRRLKIEGKNPGFPKFKSKKKSNKSFRINYKIKVGDKYIAIPKIGRVRLKEHFYIPVCDGTECSVRQKSVTVKMSKSGRWFVSVLMEEEIPDPVKKTGEVCGIDLGINDFATTSDGEVFKNHKTLRDNQSKINKLRRAHSLKKKGGKNKQKARMKLAKRHFKIACSRRDFLHKLSSRLVKTKPVIVLEDLTIMWMLKNKNLAASICDSAWAIFLKMCQHKSERFGTQIVIANQKFPSSKRCSCCGVVRDRLELSEREWACKTCATRHNRDRNAALNLKWYGEQVLAGRDPMAIIKECKAVNTASPAGINACGEEGSGARMVSRETGLGEAGRDTNKSTSSRDGGL